MKHILLILVFSTFIFSKDLIDVSFKDLDIMQLIKITSRVFNKDILVSQKIDAEVNFISNEAISKKQLLEILKHTLNENGYTLKKEKNFLKVVKISINKEAITKAWQAPKNSLEKKFLRDIKYISLINAEAKDLEKLLNKILEKRKDKKKFQTVVIHEESSNTIILDGERDEVNHLFRIVKKLDQRKKQVYVKAKIVELDNYLLNEVGFKFGILAKNSYSSGIHSFSTSLNNGISSSLDTSNIDLSIPNLGSSLALTASLNLLNRTYAMDIISEPTLLCINNIASSIYVGETVSIQTGSTTTDGGSTKNTYEREDIGLSLKVKPRVDKNRVYLDIETVLEGLKNSITNNNPDSSKKRVFTKAIVNNGESIVLGGLIEKRVEKNLDKVPYASEIPLLGELFKNRKNNSRTKNLMIIITPYIIPENKDISYVLNELSKLKKLEDKLLENFLSKFKKEEQKKKVKNQVKINHENRFENFFSQ